MPRDVDWCHSSPLRKLAQLLETQLRCCQIIPLTPGAWHNVFMRRILARLAPSGFGFQFQSFKLLNRINEKFMKSFDFLQKSGFGRYRHFSVKQTHVVFAEALIKYASGELKARANHHKVIPTISLLMQPAEIVEALAPSIRRHS